MLTRPRRNRKSFAIRNLVQETRLHSYDLISPLFVCEGNEIKEKVPSMPGVYKLSPDLLLKEATKIAKLGILAIILFPIIESNKKDSLGSFALDPTSHLLQAIKLIKDHIPELCVITDIALDPYTSHGHDGVVSEKGIILNDETVHILGKIALLHAENGVDMVAPSDMMDGRVKHIRQVLDQAGFQDVNILSYTAKYASSLYGPFRDVLNSAPSYGDKKSYQMNPTNIREALLEAKLDEQEGADMLMVKPALLYLDVISKLKAHSNLPIAAFHVSGEYALACSAAKMGWLDKDKFLLESLHSIKRAGADMILSYAGKELLEKKLIDP